MVTTKVGGKERIWNLPEDASKESSGLDQFEDVLGEGQNKVGDEELAAQNNENDEDQEEDVPMGAATGGNMQENDDDMSNLLMDDEDEDEIARGAAAGSMEENHGAKPKQLPRYVKRCLAKEIVKDKDMQQYLVDMACDSVKKRMANGVFAQALFCCLTLDHAAVTLVRVKAWIANQGSQLMEPVLLSSHTGRETARGFTAIRDGTVQFVVQVAICGEGVDVVPFQVVVFLCPHSLSVAYQLFGRSGRLIQFVDHVGKIFNVTDTNSMAWSWFTQFDGHIPKTSQFSLKDANVSEIIIPTEFYMARDL
ncbi:hypothetical protein HDU98_006037, partial [Podochytrium sp. JEL0797]